MIYNLEKSVKLCFFALFIFNITTLISFSEVEPNNSIQSAQLVAVPSNETGSLSEIEPLDLVDVFLVNIAENGYFSFGIVPDPELDVRAELLDSDGFSVLIGGNNGGVGATEGVIYSNIKTGSYYCLVHLVDGSGGYEARFRYSQVESIDVEPNDVPQQAVLIDKNSNAAGNLGFHGNTKTDKADYYQIQLDSDGELELTASPDATLDLSLHLFDANGVDVILEDTNSNPGDSETVTASHLAAGTFYVMVYNVGGYGAYSLTSLFNVDPNPNDAEPNNTLSQTNSFPSATLQDDVYVTTASGRIGYMNNQFRDDRDCFVFTVPQYSRVVFEYTQDYKEPSLGYTVYDSDKRYLHGSTSTRYDAGVYEAGTYYLNLYHRGGVGAYTVSITMTPQDDPVAFNQNAGSYTLGQTLSGVALNAEAPVYYYWFDLAQDSSVWLKLSSIDTLWVSAKLYGPKGLNRLTNLGAYYTNDPQETTIPNMLAGRYLLEVRRENGQGDITLESTVTPSLYHDAEPNDVWAEPTVFSPDSLIQGHLGFTNSRWTDNLDFYQIDLPSDGLLSVDFHGEETLWFGVEIAEFHGTTWKRIHREGLYYAKDDVVNNVHGVNLNAGTYLIQINRENGYGNYELDVSFAPNQTGDLEDNNHPFQAVSLESEQGITGHLGYVGGFQTDTVDWYQLVTPTDGTVEVYSQGEASLWYDVQLFRDDAQTRFETAGSYYTKNSFWSKNVQVKAGVNYIRVIRQNGYGVYHLFAVFTSNGTPDVDQNNFADMAQPLSVNQVVQGNLGFHNRTTLDSIDWYRLTVPAEASYKLAYQTESALWSTVRIFDSTSLNRISTDGNYYHANLFTKNVTLQPGTYYVYCLRENGAGSYTLCIGDDNASSTGVLTGTVFDSRNLEIFEVDASAYGQSVKTDFGGVYTFEHLPPGTYTAAFGKGAKYYQHQEQFTIVAGQTTTLDVTLQEANLTPPADVDHFYGFAGNGTLHLFWDPSESPDVADGGGYNLYINGEKTDLGAELFYRDFGFANGTTHEIRLTVYDKFNNESAGKTLFLTPNGEGPQLPTPTPIPVLPTPTPQPSVPTLPPPTLTPTPTMGVGEPTVTPTPPVVIVPTATPVIPTTLTPDYVIEFGGADLASVGWGEIVQNPPGQTQLIDFIGSFIPDSEDGKGLALTVNPYNFEAGDPFEYVFLYGAPPIKTVGKHVFMRMTARASDPNVSIFLAGMKADFTTFEIEGSLVVTNPANAKALTDKPMYVTCMFPADPESLNLQTGQFESPMTPITPIIQVAASAAATQPVIVWVDKLEVFLLDPTTNYPASLFDLDIK